MATRTKLAVILHADVVSSTTLVQLDEQVAHERIRAAFRRLSELIAARGGTTHEIRGADETLAKAIAINPRLSVDWVREHVHSPESRAGRHLIDGLRALGLRARSE